jgi:hypothetical protein
MSKIKAVYDTMEEVPEQYAELYEEREGKAQLSRIEGLKTEADIQRLSNALSKERDLRKAAEVTVSLFPGSPDEVNAEMDALKSQGKVPGQAHLREVEKLKQDLLNSTSQVSTLQNEIGSQKLRTTFVKEATDQGVTSSAIEDVLLWGENLFTVKEGQVVARDETNLQTPADWISDMKTSGKKDYWFEQSQGAGAKGSKGGANASGVEHFTKGTMNLTKMSAIFTDDPEKAERLAKLAGHANLDAAIKAYKPKP